MALVNASLLLGGLLAAIPIVLHLVLRQQPKRVVFPAVRFLKERHDSNRRQLQLRHWLLLLLRCGLIALGAAALARPSVASAVLGNWLIAALLLALAAVVSVAAVVAGIRRLARWMTIALATVAIGLLLGSLGLVGATLAGGEGVIAGDQAAPVAAAIVVDTAPRMAYQFRNQSRLEAAQEMSLWLLSQFPGDSSVAVLESRPSPPFFAIDRSAAKSMLDRLRITGVPEDFPTTIKKAIDLVAAADQPRREVYVLTDLSRGAWPPAATAELQARLSEQSDVSLYVIDVGAPSPQNVALGELRLSTETLVRSSELTLQSQVTSQGVNGDVAIELWVEAPDATRPILVDGKPLLPDQQIRDRQTVTLEPGRATEIEFRLRGWEPGTYQGGIRLTTKDGLPLDDQRYFTVHVREAWPVLLVAPPQVNTSLMLEVLAPFALRQTGSALFDGQTIEQTDLASQNLSGFAVVVLLDPQPLTPASWEQLGQYVEAGGNLVVALGSNAGLNTAATASFNEPAAQRLIGGKLERVWRAADRELFLAPAQFDHPALAIFREMASGVPWQELPVFRHWVLDAVPSVRPVVPLSNGKPAVLEHELGAGRIVIVTTPLSEPSRPEGRASWNELISGENPWPSFVLINELMRYMARVGESRLNYATGEVATLVNDPDRDPERYQLFPPSDDPQEVVAREGTLTVAFTEQPGAYRLKGQMASPIVRGFAANVPAKHSDLTRASREDLGEQLGKMNFHFARDRDEIVFEVGEARAGREFYPYLLVAIVLVLGLEQALANRFYRPVGSPVYSSRSA